jgi:chromatin remodeling complex protein RSC6
MPSNKKSTPVAVATPAETQSSTEPIPEVKKPVQRAKAVKIAPEPVVSSSTTSTNAPVPTTTSETNPPEEEKEQSPIDNVFQTLVDKIQSLTTLTKEINIALKLASKDYDKLKKVVDKIQKKRENARKSPSGFAKPNKISDELCDFIGVPHGTEKSRTDITRYINTYVKEHNLNKPTNRRIILPDEKLKKILNVKEGDEVTFFILQRLISHHFPVKAKPA